MRDFPIYINGNISFSTRGEIAAVMQAATFFDIDDAAIYIDSPVNGLIAYSAVPGHERDLKAAMEAA